MNHGSENKKNKKIKKIIIMAGGTGGHIFPGIAIGQALEKKAIQILWLGSQDGMETALVPKFGFNLETVKISGFRGKSFLKKLRLMYDLLQSVYQAFKIIRRYQPDVILGMGGFVAASGGIAAKLSGIPLFIHEQNSIAGLTNKILSYLAKTVFCGFPETFTGLSKNKNKFIFTGNPVRLDIQHILPKEKLHSPWRLLILGGSRGAKILNDIVPKAVRLLPIDVQPDIYHQTGQQSAASYCQDITKKRQVTVVPFIQNMAEIYQWADVIICRAGALTLAEICQMGLPAILVPYPYAVDDHQTANAKYLEKNQAAVILPQQDLTPEKISDALSQFFHSPEKYAAMASGLRLLRTPDTVEKIVDIILMDKF